MSDAPFQDRVRPWLLECFGQEIADDVVERNHRFIEEALELVQSLGCSSADAHALVDYVYDRDVGDPPQEVGGVMVTLAELCLASGLDMHQAGEVELNRIWTKVNKIRARQAAKPRGSALPQAWERTYTEANALVAAALREAAEVAKGGGFKGMFDPLRKHISTEILTLITPDQQSALDKMLAEARREGMERAAGTCRNIGTSFASDDGTDLASVAWKCEAAIRAEMGDDT